MNVAMTLLCESGSVSAELEHDAISFASAISAIGGVDVPVVHGRVEDVFPSRGYILLCSTKRPRDVLETCRRTKGEDLSSRLIPMGVPLEGVFTELEATSLPAAVDIWTLREWKSSHAVRLGSRGPHGLKRIALRLNVQCATARRAPPGGQLASEHYCYMYSPMHNGPPHLLIEYLRELERDSNTVLGRRP